MNASHLVTAGFVGMVLATYLALRALYLRIRHPLFNVVLIGAAVIVAVILGFGLTYDDFVPARRITTYLMGPATVALAVPLYRNRYLLKTYALSIAVGVGAGVAVSMATSGLLGLVAGLPMSVAISLAPKGVTIPFAVDICTLYGGDPALTIFFVVCNGTLGGSFGIWALNRIGVTDPVARGLAMGVVSHGQGTAVIFYEGERQGAMGGLAMTLSGIMTAALAPLVMPLITGW